MHDLTLVQDADAFHAVIEQARHASTLAVDVEANGLFAYRPRLCTVQLAWEEGERTKIAVIDTLRVDAAPLAPLFAAEAPIKVLHDLTFDARLLHESGAPLHHVRDTSVAARLLGAKATGLAAVLANELGIILDKHYQRHDWSRRPLEPAQLTYLSNDVAFLLQLDRAIMARVVARDIAAEVEAECGYKLVSALAPPRDQRPAYARIKGVQRLDPVARAVLMHLAMAREEIAETINVPPFKVITNDVLLELALMRPRSVSDLSRIRGAVSGRAGRYAARWLNAIVVGVKAGDIPASDRTLFEPPIFDRSAVAKRRHIESKITAFRRDEALRRGVDEQVVLPGHCVQDLAAVLATMAPRDPEIMTRIASVAGIGTKRAEQYGSALAALIEVVDASDLSATLDDPEDELSW
jgi:ribonuclease D